MNKVYVFYVSSFDGATDITDIKVFADLSAAKKHLIECKELFKENIMHQYAEYEYELQETDMVFFFQEYDHPDNYYHLAIREHEVITDECSD
jgi:hypothetical protein